VFTVVTPVLPSCTVLEVPVDALLPIAVELVTLPVMSVPYPIVVL
jgi:hypothetical protein